MWALTRARSFDYWSDGNLAAACVANAERGAALMVTLTAQEEVWNRGCQNADSSRGRHRDSTYFAAQGRARNAGESMEQPCWDATKF
jgi:hypothetical protein